MAKPLMNIPMDVRILPAKDKGGLRHFELLADFDFGKGDVLPKSYVWNGASAPLGRQRFLVASALHDHRYNVIIEMLEKHRYDGKVTKAIKKRASRMRKEADLEFRHNVRVYDNNGGIVAWVGYLGVRIGGGFAVWQGCKEYRKNNSIKEAK